MSVDRAPAPSSDREGKCPTCGGKGWVFENSTTFIEEHRAQNPCPTCSGSGRANPSPAPDEVAVAAKRLVDTIDGMQKGAEKMGGQWYFPDLVLEDRDALRAALNEQEEA